MKRIIAENVLAGIQLVYNSKANPSYSVVQVNSLLKFVCFDIKTAFETFDMEVNQALHTQPEKVMSGINLENSTKTYLDLEDVSYPFKCQTDDGRIATVIAERRTEVNDATYIVIIDHANSKDCWSNDELLFLSDRVGHLYFADGDDQTGSHLIPIQPPKPVVRTGQQVWFDTGALSTLTLIAGPVTKEGWINIYPDGPAAVMQLTKRAADSANSSNHGARVHCAYVTWEE